MAKNVTFANISEVVSAGSNLTLDLPINPGMRLRHISFAVKAEGDNVPPLYAKISAFSPTSNFSFNLVEGYVANRGSFAQSLQKSINIPTSDDFPLKVRAVMSNDTGKQVRATLYAIFEED